jgi:hypothetical protein
MYEEYIKHKSFVECCVAFIQKYPGVRLPRKSVVRKLVTKFRKTGSLLDETEEVDKRQRKRLPQNKLQTPDKISPPFSRQRRSGGPITRAVTRNVSLCPSNRLKLWCSIHRSTGDRNADFKRAQLCFFARDTRMSETCPLLSSSPPPPFFRVSDPFAYNEPRISNAVHAICHVYCILDLLMFIILHKYHESGNHALYTPILPSFLCPCD